MSDYTPTTEQVRIRYSMDERFGDEELEATWAAEFDRWLAAHDAEVYRHGFKNGYGTGREDAERDVFAVEALPFSNLLPRGIAAAAARGDGADHA